MKGTLCVSSGKYQTNRRRRIFKLVESDKRPLAPFSYQMYLVPQMATALVFFIYVSNDGLEQASAQYYNSGGNMHREFIPFAYPRRMCGPLLTNTLELVCQGRFNPPTKKSQDGGTRSQDWTNSDRENFAIFPFRSRRNALAFNGASTFRRRTRNVADECCYLKPCTLAEMSHYCESN